jgi:hypothetical protein
MCIFTQMIYSDGQCIPLFIYFFQPNQGEERAVKNKITQSENVTVFSLQKYE